MEIFARAVGRRKEAVAQVQIVRGTGKFVINNKPVEEYLQNNSFSILLVKSPFNVVSSLPQFNSETSTKLENPSSLNSSGTEKVGSSQTHLSTDYNINFDQFDTFVKVKGGGLLGQAEAIKLAVSKAVSIIDYSKTELALLAAGQSKIVSGAEDLKPGILNNAVSSDTLALEVRKQLKNKGYLTQDSRVKERRKYGLKKARKASQYHKR
jgi:small subunit ribosomal protein S9